MNSDDCDGLNEVAVCSSVDNLDCNASDSSFAFEHQNPIPEYDFKLQNDVERFFKFEEVFGNDRRLIDLEVDMPKVADSKVKIDMFNNCKWAEELMKVLEVSQTIGESIVEDDEKLRHSGDFQEWILSADSHLNVEMVSILEDRIVFDELISGMDVVSDVHDAYNILDQVNQKCQMAESKKMVVFS